MPERACDSDTSFGFIIRNHEQSERNCNRERLSQLQRLVRIGKLNCCLLFEDDVPSEPQIPDHQQHKPFNGVCVLPNMPDVDALIQEFEANYTSGPPMAEKKSAATVAKAKGIFVKKIIEIYEMKNGKTKPLDGQQADVRLTVEDKRRPKEDSLFRTVQTSKRAAETQEITEKRELANMTTTANSVSREVDVQIEINDDDNDDDDNNEENNDPDDVKEELKLTAVVPNLHVDTSSSKTEKRKIKEKNKEKSSRKLRGFLCKFNRSGSKRVTKRCRLALSQRDERWCTKRSGRIFLEPELSKEFVSKCDSAVNAKSPSGGNSRNEDGHDVLSVTESQDDSGNSYKNLQVNMFDFEDEGPWYETRDSESDDDSLSVKSVDQFLPSLDRRYNSDETADEATYLASSSFEDENNTSARVNGYDESTEMSTGLSAFADESAKDCLGQSTKTKNGSPNLGSKLQQIFAKERLKKILSLFNTKRYFKKKSAIDKTKYNWQLLQKSQQPTLSPDSGFDEPSVSLISSSTLPTSLFLSEKSTCNNYPEPTLSFRTFRPRDSLPREGISKSKRRLVLNELSHEELANVQDESSYIIPDAQTKTSYGDLFPVSSSPSYKGSTSTASSPRSKVSSSLFLKYSYLSQKIPRSTFLSLTRVDELGKELNEQLDVSELRPEYSASLNLLNGWMSSSPYQVCKEPRWRSTPTLASFAKESPCYFYEPIGRGKVYHVYSGAKRNVPIFGTGSLSNITGSSCFATVKPRNWRPYMRLEESRSFEEADGIKRCSSM
ncbi:uncharacterized protein LOC116842080 [Odontomachus brunneus]|uniref:uncharacterized protein LOC116842080 n=1 Tax=Odontomachus brunneus TaxID=486640 RepID=UPI0013F219AA|nr:uncharacterized protein LOC116842080 [Odontomachus brunneus]XP_032666659.1 uncharacterized protein LOC116842080 [Odontomachus brunneus]XP_032666660.1 uncharacterized protein LOC116842080 [Odontomachus brunneus]